MAFSINSWLEARRIGVQSFPERKQDLCSNFGRFLHRNVATQKVENILWKQLYKKEPFVPDYHSNVGYGGVFGLKYSPDGKLVVAACENNAVVMLDPRTMSIVNQRQNVHTKHCNTITFIDDLLFTTCSDDGNVAIWDVRNIKEEVLMLRGHKNWVKNVEYHKQSKRVLSAGFDDQIIAWDINNVLPNGECQSDVVLNCPRLIRMKLSPDGASMYFSTIQGIDLIAIHNLNVKKLKSDINKIILKDDFGEYSVKYKNTSLTVN
uniref:DDB1- and CUL4-associated factor 10 n=1 Tax=Ciona savignyi TaxID=51511 RepID=H2YET3_CIOSA